MTIFPKTMRMFYVLVITELFQDRHPFGHCFPLCVRFWNLSRFSDSGGSGMFFHAYQREIKARRTLPWKKKWSGTEQRDIQMYWLANVIMTPVSTVACDKWEERRIFFFLFSPKQVETTCCLFYTCCFALLRDTTCDIRVGQDLKSLGNNLAP